MPQIIVSKEKFALVKAMVHLMSQPDVGVYAFVDDLHEEVIAQLTEAGMPKTMTISEYTFDLGNPGVVLVEIETDVETHYNIVEAE